MPDATSSTQQFVEVKEIRDGVVYLKNGGLRRVFMVSGVNFDLKSFEEQEVILASFQRFLNTLDFGIQFYIHSRKVNIDGYLEKIRARKNEEENELMKVQIDDYVDFVRSFVQDNPVISKTFFAVVPYDSVDVKKAAARFFSVFGRQKAAENQATDERMEEQKKILQLNQRADEVKAGLASIGLQAAALDDDVLMELFYNLYNPQFIEKRNLEILKKTTNKNKGGK